MKRILIIVLLICPSLMAYNQPLPDSILSRYNSASTVNAKGDFLWNYLESLSNDSNEVTQALNILTYFRNQKDENGADITGLYIAGRLAYKGNFITALNMGFSSLSNCEKRNDSVGILYAYNVIHISFALAKNYDESITWQKKAIPFATAINDERKLAMVYNNLGAVYAQASMPDSGLVYAQKAVNIDIKSNDQSQLPYSLSTLAENYIAGRDFDVAIPFLRRALTHAISNADAWITAYCYLDFTQAYLGLKNYDSTIFYARKCIDLSLQKGFQETLLKSYQSLYKTFEITGKSDSVNKYFRLATTVKDSIYSTEKTNNIQAISFREQLRQQEVESEKLKVEKERKQNIQYALIAIGIIILISLYLLLSRSFITNTKLIQFLGVVALLIVFEFMNLLLHPFLERVTHHSPVLMLLALVCIAELLVPLHHKLEKWATIKLVEKNKKIRLAAAKKTIEKLEKE